jgi:hypothetical protein
MLPAIAGAIGLPPTLSDRRLIQKNEVPDAVLRAMDIHRTDGDHYQYPLYGL